MRGDQTILVQLGMLLGLALCNAALAVPYPVIFVHGIGDSSAAWRSVGPVVSAYYEKYYKTASHPYFKAGSGIGEHRDDKDFQDNIRNHCVYMTFSDYYASPADQARELAKVIDDARREAFTDFPQYFTSLDEVRVNLVAHSLGGLVCREYLVEHPKAHHVDYLITISTPNKGSAAFNLKWYPYILDAAGIAGALVFANPWPLGLLAVGVGLDVVLHARGIRLLSPAANSMQTNSSFLKQLNQTPLPEDVKYRCIIAKASDHQSGIFNFLLGHRDGGDGAVSAASQSLRWAGIPNFDKLDYEERAIDGSHFTAYTGAAPEIIDILGLK